MIRGRCNLLLLEYVILEMRSQLTHYSFKYQGGERPNLLGLSCRLRFECGMTFPTLCFTPERLMGSREQSTVGSFPKLCFLLPLHRCLNGLQKQFINNFVFPTWACTAGFYNKNNNKYITMLSYECTLHGCLYRSGP